MPQKTRKPLFNIGDNVMVKLKYQNTIEPQLIHVSNAIGEIIGVYKRELDSASWVYDILIDGVMMRYINQAKIISLVDRDMHEDINLVAKLSYLATERLSEKRQEGKYGWWNPEVCNIDYLYSCLLAANEKANYIDVAIYAAMCYIRSQRGE